MKYIFT
jgi:hypothetical protein